MPPSSRRKGGACRCCDNDDKKTFVSTLVGQLMSLQLCSSDEEYTSVAEAIASSSSSSLSLDEAPPSKEDLEEIVLTLVDYFEGDVEEHDAKNVIHTVVMDVWGDDFAENLGWIDNNTADSDEHDDNEGDERDDDDDDGDFVGEGECQLCERAVKLTRHHLIPKTTWSRIKKRLWNAASTIETYHSLDDEISHEKKEFTRNKLEKMLGMTDISDIPKAITHDSVRTYLFKVCLLCRQCHSAVHRIHTEMELATEYNTIDKLFGDEELLKFGKWASKQRPGKYAL
mmetsp:Transcript_3973/g.5965  ORF Transcript_3973/g.5965 Transcript_3973/m.5965 type:complete len:284 (+) Transcript_3973:103-954(+)